MATPIRDQLLASNDEFRHLVQEHTDTLNVWIR